MTLTGETPLGEPVDGPSFEEALKELERVVERLESESLSLDESLRLYQRGVELKKLCEVQLEEAEGRIEELTTGENGGLTTRQFSLGEG